jgi:glucose/arabinose dehydrogenase
VTVGDRRRREWAQRLDNHAGKVLRLTADGGIPPDNPFVGQTDALPEIYSYGHRNPQGLALHPETGRVWLHEHGPRGGDEINLIAAGANYGWPLVTFGREYHGPTIGVEPPEPGFASPLHHWTPSIAPSGMAFYAGEAFPAWRGDLFVGALVHRHLQRLRFRDGQVVAQEKLLTERGWRIRDVRAGPDGYLYVLTDAGNGVLARLEPGADQSRP